MVMKMMNCESFLSPLCVCVCVSSCFLGHCGHYWATPSSSAWHTPAGSAHTSSESRRPCQWDKGEAKSVGRVLGWNLSEVRWNGTTGTYLWMKPIKSLTGNPSNTYNTSRKRHKYVITALISVWRVYARMCGKSRRCRIWRLSTMLSWWMSGRL